MKPQRPQKPSNKWINLTAEQASTTTQILSAHQIASQIYLQYLTLAPEQEMALSEIYQSGDSIEEKIFRTEDESDQLAAAAMLATNYLDLDSRESLGSRWSIRWGKSDGKDKSRVRKVLYQWYVIY